MIAKERTIPIKVVKMEVLLKRIAQNHPKRHLIKEELLKRRAGHRGEQAIDFYLSKLSPDDFYIFHNVRLSNGKYYFQMDTLILSAQTALILEVKNFAGTIYFDPVLNQCIQTLPNGEKKGYLNPIEQVRQQKNELLIWLNKRKITLPIETLVIISKPTTIINAENSKMLHNVIHSQYLTSKIQTIMRYCKNAVTTQKELKKLTRTILREHVDESFDILSYFKIASAEIIRGVYCVKCNQYTMRYFSGYWQCLLCKQSEKQAHKQAITDYFLLNNNLPISNKQFRDFFQIHSEHIAKYLLKSLNLPTTGTTKSKRYHSPTSPQQIK
ncbi:nuclease-related domain-containing protein [Cytobacillus purgationiresistens]|uniref:NERD domain-containing protein n=1 Tax=Cytobacillus purgationiresistens TaxID=863449 RepID=A0ABU0ADI3_9BACI|nr:nuclease-related domain-containing protein [Cytobacillus purgationiresistens]MDQ0269100.1 hypothetical protein [Cytobacillus purgationiresistens]